MIYCLHEKQTTATNSTHTYKPIEFWGNLALYICILYKAKKQDNISSNDIILRKARTLYKTVLL